MLLQSVLIQLHLLHWLFYFSFSKMKFFRLFFQFYYFFLSFLSTCSCSIHHYCLFSPLKKVYFSLSIILYSFHIISWSANTSILYRKIFLAASSMAAFNNVCKFRVPILTSLFFLFVRFVFDLDGHYSLYCFRIHFHNQKLWATILLWETPINALINCKYPKTKKRIFLWI